MARVTVIEPTQLFERILVIGLPLEQVEVLRPELEPCGACFMSGTELRFRSQIAHGTGCVVVFSPGVVTRDRIRVKRVLDTRFIPSWSSGMLESIELFIRARLKSADTLIRVARDRCPISYGRGSVGIYSKEYNAALR